MNKKKLIRILGILLCCFIGMVIVISRQKPEQDMYYKDYILTLLDDKGNSNFEKAILYVEEQLTNPDLSPRERALNLLAKNSYQFMQSDTESVLRSYEETELLLKELQMLEEVIYLYSMVTNSYLEYYEYEMAYRYINEAEILSLRLYEAEEDSTKKEEILSSLLAIMYSKASLGMKIGLEKDATKTFEKAEELRETYTGRERADIYKNIARYYYGKQDYLNVEKYAIVAIERFMEGNSIQINEASKQNVKLLMLLLADAYLNLEQIEACIEILNLVNEQMVEDELNALMYHVSAGVYLYYQDYEKAIENLIEGYNTLSESYDVLHQSEYVNRIIQIALENNIDLDFMYWYEELRQLHLKEDELKNTQFLMSEIINSDYIQAQYKIKLLEYDAKILKIQEIIICIILIFISNQSYKLYKKNKVDGLTRVFNRNYFNCLYERYQKNKTPHHIIILDIDNFKQLNDTFGHLFGDMILIRMGKELKKFKSKKVKAFRYGGEEFVLIVDHCDRQEVLEIGEKIRKIVEEMSFENNVKITISVGIGQFSVEKNNSLEQADINLYKSKNSGKNKVTFED